jgi:TonB family protein
VSAIGLDIVFPFGKMSTKPDQAHLPVDSSSDSAVLLEARRKGIAVIRKGRVELRASGEWQQVEVTGAGRQITIAMNEVVVGVFQIEDVAGHILFDCHKGGVQLRKVALSNRETDVETADAVFTFKQLKDAGGQPPRLIRNVGPTYTREAMAWGIKGVVKLEIVILQDGSVGPIGIVRSLDPGLDLSAVNAVRLWKFAPGVLNGKTVQVFSEVEMSFTTK